MECGPKQLKLIEMFIPGRNEKQCRERFIK